MPLTRKYLCELILRRVYNGDVSDDAGTTIEDVNGWLNFGIASAAMKNYADTAQMDVEQVGDAFYSTITGLSLAKDSSTGYYTTSLPTTPYALPKGFDISGVYIEGAGELSTPLLRIDQKYLGYYNDLRMPKNKTGYWIEGRTVFINSRFVLDGKSIRVRMATSGAVDNLDAEVNLPDDLAMFAVDLIYQKIMPFINARQDNSNDGIDAK